MPEHGYEVWKIMPNCILDKIERWVKTLPAHEENELDMPALETFIANTYGSIVGSQLEYEGEIVGAFACVVSSWVFLKPLATEILLYIEPQHRSFINVKSMVEAGIEQLQEAGVGTVRVGSTSGYDPKGVGLLYKHLGFTEDSTVYTKTL